LKYGRRLLSVVLLGLLLFSLVGCGNEKVELVDPPILKVLYEDESIDAVQGTYSWTIDNKDGTKTSVESDSADPGQLVKNTSPLIVSPKSTITLNFSDKPKEVRVNIWGEEKVIEQEVTDNKVVIPNLKGLITYEVIATWEQGTVHYAFSVEIR